MSMIDKIIFDRYYCINSALKKDLLVHFIVQRRHLRLKAFILMLIPGGVQLLVINMCFAPGNKPGVLTARAK